MEFLVFERNSSQTNYVTDGEKLVVNVQIQWEGWTNIYIFLDWLNSLEKLPGCLLGTNIVDIIDIDFIG